MNVLMSRDILNGPMYPMIGQMKRNSHANNKLVRKLRINPLSLAITRSDRQNKIPVCL